MKACEILLVKNLEIPLDVPSIAAEHQISHLSSFYQYPICFLQTDSSCSSRRNETQVQGRIHHFCTSEKQEGGETRQGEINEKQS